MGIQSDEARRAAFSAIQTEVKRERMRVMVRRGWGEWAGKKAQTHGHLAGRMKRWVGCGEVGKESSTVVMREDISRARV